MPQENKIIFAQSEFMYMRKRDRNGMKTNDVGI